MARVRALSMWKGNVKSAWPQLSIESVDVHTDDQSDQKSGDTKTPLLKVGSEVKISARVNTGKLDPTDISVEIYYGKVDSAGNIEDGQACKMDYSGNGDNNGTCTFQGKIPCTVSGQHGFALRILPRHDDLVEQFEPGMILWEKTAN